MRQSNAHVAVGPFGLRMGPDGRRPRSRAQILCTSNPSDSQSERSTLHAYSPCFVAFSGKETMTSRRLPRRPVCVVSFAMALSLVVVTGFLGCPTPASASYWRSCSPPEGTGYASASLRVHDVHCSKARRRVTGFLRKAHEQGPDVVVRGGFTALPPGLLASRVGGAASESTSTEIRSELPATHAPWPRSFQPTLTFC